MIEIAIGILVLAGGFFAMVAGIGILRLPDVLIRMHASTKAGTLGCGLILLAAGLFFSETGVTAQVALTILFLLLTAPIAAHMIGRAALKIGVPLFKTRRKDG
jgi:multicomponent Na+:H+ antiporter subunit G